MCFFYFVIIDLILHTQHKFFPSWRYETNKAEKLLYGGIGCIVFFFGCLAIFYWKVLGRPILERLEVLDGPEL